jgi:hypothetical protein
MEYAEYIQVHRISFTPCTLGGGSFQEHLIESLEKASEAVETKIFFSD